MIPSVLSPATYVGLLLVLLCTSVEVENRYAHPLSNYRWHYFTAVAVLLAAVSLLVDILTGVSNTLEAML